MPRGPAASLVGVLGVCLLAAAALAQSASVAAPCQPQVEQQLARWRVAAPPRPQPTAGDTVLRHWPTPRADTWVAEYRDAEGSRLVRVTPALVTTLAWSASCSVTTATRPRPGAATPRFSDEDLARAVAGPARGVVYVWSPHMPLSVDGYRAIVTAASERGLRVDAVLDPGADRAFAATERARGGLPASALRVADSVELLFRDVLIHAPSVQAYGQGRLRGSAFPGFHTAAEYGAFLDRVLPPGQ